MLKQKHPSLSGYTKNTNIFILPVVILMRVGSSRTWRGPKSNLGFALYLLQLLYHIRLVSWSSVTALYFLAEHHSFWANFPLLILCPDSEWSRARSKPYRGLVVLATSARRRWLSQSHQCCFLKLCADIKNDDRWCSSLKIFLSQSLTEDVGLYGQAKPVPPAPHQLCDQC